MRTHPSGAVFIEECRLLFLSWMKPVASLYLTWISSKGSLILQFSLQNSAR
jgi:hypothetical protein